MNLEKTNKSVGTQDTPWARCEHELEKIKRKYSGRQYPFEFSGKTMSGHFMSAEHSEAGPGGCEIQVIVDLDTTAEGPATITDMNGGKHTAMAHTRRQGDSHVVTIESDLS